MVHMMTSETIEVENPQEIWFAWKRYESWKLGIGNSYTAHFVKVKEKINLSLDLIIFYSIFLDLANKLRNNKKVINHKNQNATDHTIPTSSRPVTKFVFTNFIITLTKYVKTITLFILP